ncbi:MAG: hypothetical protein ACREEU_05780, partial [Acetobacteraceae bacterium]
FEWHMRQKLAPMLFDDADKEAVAAERASIAAKAERSPAAISKETTGVTPHGLPVHSVRTLLADLGSPIWARRSGQPGAQYHRHRDHARLSADRPHHGDTDPAPSPRAARPRRVASDPRLTPRLLVAD